MREFVFFGMPSQPWTRPSSGSDSIRSLMILIILLASSDLAFAQENFATPPTAAPQSNQWSPPAPDHTPLIPPQDMRAIPKQAPSISFPQESIPFDPGLETANFLAPVREREPDSEVTGGSAAGMMASLGNVTGEQLSGMAAKMKQGGGWMTQAQTLFGSSDISRMLGSLTLVLGIYFAVVWLFRKLNPGGHAGIPAEVVDVMGHIPFGPKRELQLVRLGSKLLLLMNTAEGTSSIGEITDPDEAEYLASLCLGKQKKKTESYAAIRNAANRVAARHQTNHSQPKPEPQPNLANILRTLDQATKQNSAIFEA